MNRDADLTYAFWVERHEYPDPDYAAHVTQYPWVEETEQVQAPHPSNPSPTWEGRSSSNSDSETFVASTTGLDVFRENNDDNTLSTNVERCDPDYETSDGALSEDEIISDEDSADSTEEVGLLTELNAFHPSPSRDGHKVSGRRWTRTRGIGNSRRGKFGRGGKGIKRGPRKAVEPTEEFKAVHSQATIAFIDQRYEEAEQLTLQAILINPEIYPAHNLLSQIHTAKGEEDKAISAAWTGAHTNHRDPEIWSRTASLILNKDSENRDSTLQGAIYCMNRIINLERNNVEARYQRATLYQEIGHTRKAATEYERLLKQLPHDTTVLRHLAEICIELEKPERALAHYVASIAHLRVLEPETLSTFSWSDVNIVTELYGFQERYHEGIVQLKALSRWRLGRGQDKCWDSFNDDDREWDLEDQPRRTELKDFLPGAHDATSYGDGLPLELRIKLGVFRLRDQEPDLEEAINHFEWLDPEDIQLEAKMYDYADLFREAGNALRRSEFYQEALRYYEPLRQVSDCVDTLYLSELASCYRALGLKKEAEECYDQINNANVRNDEAPGHSIGNCYSSTLTRLGYANNAHEPQRLKRRTGGRAAASARRRRPSCLTDTLILPAPLPKRQTTKNSTEDSGLAEEDDIRSLFYQRQSITENLRKGDRDCKGDWMIVTKKLLDNFRNNKVFYSVDKHHKFYGYSKEARAMSARPKHELDAMNQMSKSIYETPNGDHILVPDNYCGIEFRIWLDMFLEYGLMLALEGEIDLAYEIIASAYHANVFFHSQESLCLIHICWFTCALNCNDDETLCNVARWFIREYQFVTDGYRLFSSLNKLCDSENSWFNCGPSQKYILRQLKAVDFSLLDDGHRKHLIQGKASYSTRDSDGKAIQATDMDVALLMLYGHILHAGRSYSYAINYYLRALALDPVNSMIKLSLAQGYIHYALKRQAGNRHQILMQGFTFLAEYYDARCSSTSLLQKQEAEYNVGHAYHLVGLTHLARPYYERCLNLYQAIQMKDSNYQAEGFALEAAVNLQCFEAASGNVERAREIVENWMIL
ncbi:transcription factor TFIIIC subunit tfc4 [Lecanora helva]